MELSDYVLSKHEKRFYVEKTFKGTDEEYKKLLDESSTLYIANISTAMREERLWHLFALCGEVRRVIMGVNSNKHTPCGFAFIEYYSAADAQKAIVFFRGFELDGRVLAVDKDMGFAEGRQYGRGIFGGKLKSDNYKKRIHTQYGGQYD